MYDTDMYIGTYSHVLIAYKHYLSFLPIFECTQVHESRCERVAGQVRAPTSLPRWTVLFVRPDPNGQTRMKCGLALELS